MIVVIIFMLKCQLTGLTEPVCGAVGNLETPHLVFQERFTVKVFSLCTADRKVVKNGGRMFSCLWDGG